MRISTLRNKLPHLVRALGVLLFWVAVWWTAAALTGKEILLPSPLTVLRAFVILVQDADFWFSVVFSLSRILIGYAAGCLTGILLAALCFRFRLADALLSPVLSIIRAVPVASFIILALVWIGKIYIPSFIAFLMVLPIISGNVRAGLACTDAGLSEVAQLYHFSTGKKIRHLYVPALLPHFLSGARTSLGLAWKAGIAAEVLCSLSHSIGGGIYNAKLYLETDRLFAWTITVILISMLMEKLLFLHVGTPKRQRRKENKA